MCMHHPFSEREYDQISVKLSEKSVLFMKLRKIVQGPGSVPKAGDSTGALTISTKLCFTIFPSPFYLLDSQGSDAENCEVFVHRACIVRDYS